MLLDISSTNAHQFHPCKSLAVISETVAPPGASKQPLMRRLSEPCTCPSLHHMASMEGTIAFVVPELSEKTLMNVSCVYVMPVARSNTHS